MLVVLVLAGLGAWTALAADISGQWTADVPGREGQTQAYTFTFKVDGAKLTGTIATPRGESPISDGKIEGNQLSFTQTLEFGGNQMKFLYKGTVSGNEIKMSRQREGADTPPREFVARKKS